MELTKKDAQKIVNAMNKARNKTGNSFTANGHQVLINVHSETGCNGHPCCIHHPSDHSMKDFPMNWRGDRGIMERICPHGIGHPDPDDNAFIRRTRGDKIADAEGIHGCDGCCSGHKVK